MIDFGMCLKFGTPLKTCFLENKLNFTDNKTLFFSNKLKVHQNIIKRSRKSIFDSNNFDFSLFLEFLEFIKNIQYCIFTPHELASQ